MTEATSPIPVGAVVDGKYEVERVLGSGGMGVVVAARHLQLGKTVALKFLLKHAYESPEAMSRFVREGQALARITSPHVARVMDVGTLDSGEPYLVMEYLEGSDLGALIKRERPLSIQEAVQYLLQACEAVAEAHAKGIVHRDLKPSNLFLTQSADGAPLVKVLDFGISKSLITQPAGLAAHDTSTGALVGSPMYMSPEQIRDARRVDARTDIWALGVILHELLTGKPPFQGETLAGTLASVAADPPAPVRALRPDIPVALESVIRRCLQKSPQRRFASVAELARALGEFGPADAQTSVDRISRLLGSSPPSLVPQAAPAQQNRDQTRDDHAVSATLPSWEGETAPMATSPALFPPRVRYALVAAVLLGSAAGLWLFRDSMPPPSVGKGAPSTESRAAAPQTVPSPSGITSAIEPTPALPKAPSPLAPVPAPARQKGPTLVAKKTPPLAAKKSTSAPKALSTQSIADIDDGTADRK
jgi:serine/threonine-protein kinase